MRFSFVSFDESERGEVRMRPELKPNLQISRRMRSKKGSKCEIFELRAQDRRLRWTFSWKLSDDFLCIQGVTSSLQNSCNRYLSIRNIYLWWTIPFSFFSTVKFFLLFRSVPWKRKINSVSISRSFAYFFHSSHHGLRAQYRNTWVTKDISRI